MTGNKKSSAKSSLTNLDFVICLLLAAVTLAIYWQTRHFEFLYFDDQLFVSHFPNLKAGLTYKNIVWAFTSTILETNYWVPLTWISFLLDYEIYGLDAGGFHITNVLFHASNTVLLFILLRKITGSLWQSAFVAALFGLHPLHVESVAWVTERKDVLSTFFFLLALLSYSKYTSKKQLTWYLLCLFIFFAGLMAKPMLVTLPLVLLLLDYWPLVRYKSGADKNKVTVPSAVRLIAEKIPFFVLILIVALVTFSAQSKAGNVGSLDAYPLTMRVANALLSYVTYIGKMFYPVNLAALYPYPESIPGLKIAVSTVILILFTLIALRTVHSRPYLMAGWLWYLVTLLPVIGFVKVGPQAMADRYTYIPLIGLLIIIAWGIPPLLAGWRHKKPLLAASALLVVASMSVITWKQIGYWKDTVSVFKHTVNKTTNNPYAHAGLGIGYLKQGDLDKAVFHLHEAVSLKPNYILALKNLGIGLEEQGHLKQAIEYYNQVIELDEAHDEIYNDKGVALQKLQRVDGAVENFSIALKLNPDNLKAHNNLAALLARQGRAAEAIQHYEEALRIDPLLYGTYNELGVLYGKLANYDLAVNNFLKALQLAPDSAAIHNNIGVTYANLEKFSEAYSHFSKAVMLEPGNMEMQANMKKAERLMELKIED